MSSKTKKDSSLSKVDHPYGIVSKIAGPLAIAVGGIVIVGWLSGLRIMTSMVSGYSTMKPNTAVCFILCGISLLLVRASEKQVFDARSFRIRFAKACALVVTVLSLLTLGEHLFQINLGIDQMFIRDTLSNSPLGHPGRSSVATMFGLFLLGGSLFCLCLKSALSVTISQIMVLLALVDATIGAGAYVYGVENLYAVTLFTTMAAPTAVLLALLSIGALFARPDRSLISVITSPHTGGQMARLILPWAVTVPFFIGWVRLQGEHAGLYGTAFGLALFATSNVIMFAILVWGSAKSLNDRSLESIQSDNRYRFLADAMPEIVWTTKADGNVDYFNQRWFDYTGLTIEQTKDWGWTPVVHPEDLDQCIELWTKSLKTGCAYDIEYRFKRSDGVYRWHLGRAFPMRNDEGEITQWVGSCTDIDEQKRARTELEQRVEGRTKELREQALILDLANDTVFIRDRENRITYWNQGAERLYGWSKAEALGNVTHSLFKTKFPVSLDKIEAQITAIGHWEGELRHTRRDGSLVTVASSWTLQRDANGQPTSIIELNYDITPRKQAEEESRKSRERLDAILTGSLDGVIVYESVRDKEGVLCDLRFVMINPASEKLMRQDASDLLGHTLLEKFPSVFSDGLFEKFTRIIEENTTLDFEHLSHRSDPPRWYRIAGVKLGDGLVVSYTEITIRKQYEQQLQEAKQRAELADHAKSDFLANMSHEIRTPMNGVIGMTGLLLDTDLDTEQRRLAETTRNSAESLLGLINDILDFSKIEAGQMVFEELDFDLRKVVEDTLEMMAGQAEAKGIELVGGVGPEVETKLRGDPGRVHQLLTNLISNAIKFTQSGEVAMRVSTKMQTERDVFVRIEIRDTGIGIPSEVQARLFKSFVQADSSTSRKFGGTGLGLAICKRLAEAMNGTIGVESAPGQGSTFWVTLRFSRQVAAKTEKPNVPEFGNARVLIVDDNASSQQFLHRQIVAWRLSDSCASTGEAALTLLRQAVTEKAPYSLAIIDMQMPVLDGLALIRKINTDSQLKATRLILLIPFGRPIQVDELKALNIAACCIKPVRQSALFDCLVQVLNGTPNIGATSQTEPFIRSNDSPTLRSERVLLAEDNVVNQQVALGNLRRLGYSADVATNGFEVLNALEDKKYDIVLMDCQMPELDGYETTKEIRKREKGGHPVWIIAMTANVMAGDREKCLAVGMDDYISKPLRRPELRSAMERVVTTTVIHSDDHVLHDLMADGEDQFAELIELFIASAPNTLHDMECALAKKSAADLSLAAHTLKGSCSNFGASSLFEICTRIEIAARSGKLQDATDLIASAGKELASLIESLKSYRKA